MTSFVVFLIFSAGVFISSSAESDFKTVNNINNTLCLEANVVCPTVDGPDSIYASLPDCTKFCQCSNGVPYLHNCPSGLHFNPVLNVCDWPQSAGCTNSSNECSKTNISCPAVDGPNSIYGPLPDCTKFCQCSNGAPYVHNCPIELYFNPTLNVCDYPENSGCSSDINSTQATDTTTTEKNTSTTKNKPTSQVYETTTSNECTQTNLSCPVVDGLNSIYGPLPDCTKFCQCSNGVPYVHNCPEGLYFNPSINVCDYPEDAGCTSDIGSTQTADNTTTKKTTPTTENEHTTQVYETSTNNECTQTNLNCPAVDGPDSIYGPLPDCTKFCQCSNGVPYVHNCPKGLHFNPFLNICVYPEDAGCTNNINPTKASDNTTTEKSTPTTQNEPTTQIYETSTSNECTQTNLSCPAVDGPNSIYGPLPDCTKFCQCSNGIPYVHNCPLELHFNPVLNVCDFPEQAGCNKGAISTTEVTNTSEEEITKNEESSTLPEEEITTEKVEESTTENNEITSEATDSAFNITTEKETTYYEKSSTLPEDEITTGAVEKITTENEGSTSEVTDRTINIITEEETTYYEESSTLPEDEKTTKAAAEITTENEESTSKVTASTINIITEEEITDNEESSTSPFDEITTVAAKESTIENEESSSEATVTATELEEETTSKDYENTTNSQSNAEDETTEENSTIPEAVTTEKVEGDTSTETTSDESQQSEETTTRQNEEDYSTEISTTTTEPIPCSTVTIIETTITTTIISGTEYCLRNDINCSGTDERNLAFKALADFTKYCQCLNGIPYLQSCPEGLQFNPDLNVCNLAENTTDGTANGIFTKISENKITETITECSADLSTTKQNEQPTEESLKIWDIITNTTEDNKTDENRGSKTCTDFNIVCPTVDPEYPIFNSLPDCTKYCKCSNGVPYLFECPDGLHFNPVLNVCDLPLNAGCDIKT